MLPEDCKISLKSRGICVIIPTYGNAGTVVDVVQRTQVWCDDIFVVLDGCADDTPQRLATLERQPRIIALPRNTGKGNALRMGFRRALAEGFAYAITLDADGQHYPEDIPLLLEANRRHPGALVVGCRQGLDRVQRSKGSRFANAFSNLWFFLQTWIPLRDTQTGYRLYPLRRLRGLSLLTARYEAELELLVLSAWRGVPLVAQPVRVHYPPREERVSHFRPVADFARISLLNVVLCILAALYGLPRTILRWLFRLLRTLLVFFSYVVLMLLVVMPGAFFYLLFGGKSERKKAGLHRGICRIMRRSLRVLGFLGIRFSLGGRTEEDFSRPAVIICNHQSVLDLLPMMALTPRLVILTADWVWRSPLYGFIIRQADFLPASRGIVALEPKLKELAAKGYSVVVYPESTRSKDGGIGRFHQGAFYLAARLGLDILPVVLYGTGRALPRGGRLLRSWPLRMEIDDRMGPDALSAFGDSYQAQASALRRYYKTRYTAIADRMEQTLK